MRKRPRGCGVVALLALALPLLADEESGQLNESLLEVTYHEHLYQNTVVVVPLRPPWSDDRIVVLALPRVDVKEKDKQDVTGNITATRPLDEEHTDHNETNTTAFNATDTVLPMRIDSLSVDYASKSAGGLILEKSPDFQGTSHLLTADADQYALVPCAVEPKYVVIGLSEDILVKRIALHMYERYSSHVHQFQVLGSTVSSSWVDLGEYQADFGVREQVFELRQPMWARYLKVRFLSHYGDEHYCTLSQITVHGSTVLQGFHEQWAEQEEETGGVEQEGESVEPPMMESEASLSTAATNTDSHDAAESASDPWPAVGQGGVGRQPPWTASDRSSALSSASIILASSYVSSRPPLTATDFGRNRSSSASPWSSGHAPEEPDVDRLIANESESLSSLTDLPLLQHLQQWLPGLGVAVDDLPVLSGRRAAVDTTVEGQEATAVERTAGEDAAPVAQEATEAVEVSQRSDDVKMMPSTVVPPTAATPSQLTQNHPPTDDTAAQERHSILARLLQRLPSADCLEQLDFADFRARALKARSSGPSAQAAAGGAVEPIFKKLTDEIRTLQASVAVHDQFARDTVACYQRVVVDLLAAQEAVRIDHEARLTKLEGELRGGLVQWIVAIRRLLSPLLWWMWQVLTVPLLGDLGRIVNALRWMVLSALVYVVYRTWNRIPHRQEAARPTPPAAVVVCASCACSVVSSDSLHAEEQAADRQGASSPSSLPALVGPTAMVEALGERPTAVPVSI